MKQLSCLAIIYILIINVGCLNDSARAKNPAEAQVPVAPPAQVQTPVSTTPGNNSNPVQNAVPTTTAVPVNSTSVGANPAHGLPGHRCDIPVGAPLDSKATTTIQPQASQAGSTTTTPQATVIPANSTPASNPAQTAGLNPAHGQPGHRCDIAVGAPLNSKPAQK
jgi:uncharacterized protein YvpB